MNLIKRIWFLYGWLSDVDRAIISVKSYKKGKDVRDSLIMELVAEKKKNNEKSNLSRSINKTFYILGIPIIVGFFAWGIFEGVIKSTEVSFFDGVAAFSVTSIVAYLLGATWRSFWWKVTPKCPKCKSFLFCRECDAPIFEADEEPYDN